MSRTFPQLVAIVLINEILPREKKFGVSIRTNIAGALCNLEFTKQIDRRTHRKLLDLLYEEEIQRKKGE